MPRGPKRRHHGKIEVLFKSSCKSMLTAKIPTALHEKLKDVAYELGVTVGELVRYALVTLLCHWGYLKCEFLDDNVVYVDL